MIFARVKTGRCSLKRIRGRVNKPMKKADVKRDCQRCEKTKARFKRAGCYALVLNCTYGAAFCAKEQHDAQEPHSQEKPYEYLIVGENATAVLGTDADVATIAAIPGAKYIGPSKKNPRQNILVIKRYIHEQDKNKRAIGPTMQP